MSSPPPPPNPYTPTPISNPKMRRPHPTSSGPDQQQQQSQHQAKRQRTHHPLRQTSFPASEDIDPRVFTNNSAARSDVDTGSVTGSFTGSLDGITGLTSAGGGGGVKRKRGKGRTGRPRKNREGTPTGSAKGSTVDGESGKGGAGSVVDGDGGSSVKGGAGGDGASRAGGEEEEEEEEDDVEGQLFEGEGGPTDTEAEKKNLAVLIDAFNSDQSWRYNLFKRTKLKKEVLRRTVNHVLSQSVPPSVVTTVSGYSKLFIGEIVERARTVQQEWADAYDQLAVEVAEAEAAKAAESEAAKAAEAMDTAPASGDASADTSAMKKEPEDESMKQTTPNESFLSGLTEAAQENPYSPAPAPAPASNASPNTAPDGIPSSTPQTPTAAPAPAIPQPENLTSNQKPLKLPPNPHRSQLLPSHLREAVRRYKVDGEGGGVGYSGLSLKGMGTKGAVTCTIGGVGGRRLFR